MIRDQQLKIFREIENLDRESRRMCSDQKDQLGKLGKRLQETLRDAGHKPSQDQIAQVIAELSETTMMASETSTEHQILRSIHFPSLKARHAKIDNAHQETFDWIFKPASRTSVDQCSNIRLNHWLRSQNGIYWVTGNPGSGKSTLMKYLIDNPKTEEALKVWAQGKQLVTANYYFWNAGNELQKSHEGLLRSLLYEMLRKCPEVIQGVCSSRWYSIEHRLDNHGPWDISELSQTLERFIHQDFMSWRFCFFIDGLDEFEGDHHEIVRILNVISESPNIKICLSSRPWNVFEDAYGQNASRKLYLQDLTRGDIAFYVRDKLGSHRVLESLTPEDKAQYRNLIEEIVKRSKGVFLWVILVVRSLNEGFTNGDAMSTLEDTLYGLPVDLEQYFQHIIDKVDTRYQKDMARTFQEAIRATDVLSLVAHSFLDEPDPSFAVILRTAKMDNPSIDSRNEKMRRRINARCKGLLEVCVDPSTTYYWAHRVEFLHRTVRDFLLTREMQKLLNRYLDPSVNVDRSLCRAYLALAKTMPSDRELQTLVQNVVRHSYKAELATNVSDCSVLDELERTHFSWKGRASGLDGHIHTQTTPIFDLAVDNNLHIYIRDKLDEPGPDQTTKARSLVGRSFLSSRGSDKRPAAWAFWLLGITSDYKCVDHYGLRLQTLKLLLKHGANPNRRHLDGTVFDTLLEWLHSVREVEKRNWETDYLFKILEMLTDHGAAPNSWLYQGRARLAEDLKPRLEEIFRQFPPELATLMLKRLRPPESKAEAKSRHRLRFWLRS